MGYGQFGTGFWILAVVLGVGFGFACMAIARNKGLNPGGYFVLGFFLGIFGLLITALVPARNQYRPPYGSPPPPPPYQPPPTSLTKPGWYPDPWAPGHIRFHDGTQWTSDSQPGSTF